MLRDSPASERRQRSATATAAAELTNFRQMHRRNHLCLMRVCVVLVYMYMSGWTVSDRWFLLGNPKVIDSVTRFSGSCSFQAGQANLWVDTRSLRDAAGFSSRLKCRITKKICFLGDHTQLHLPAQAFWLFGLKNSNVFTFIKPWILNFTAGIATHKYQYLLVISCLRTFCDQ